MMIFHSYVKLPEGKNQHLDRQNGGAWEKKPHSIVQSTVICPIKMLAWEHARFLMGNLENELNTGKMNNPSFHPFTAMDDLAVNDILTDMCFSFCVFKHRWN